MSVVAPVAIVAALAIVCVVVAVLGAAHRADQVALDTERELFTRALTNQGERVFREMQPAATSDAAYRRLRGKFDADWAETYLKGPLQSFFDHDFIFVVDAADELIYVSALHGRLDPGSLPAARAELQPVLDVLHGKMEPDAPGGIALAVGDARKSGQPYAVRLQNFFGRTAIVAGVAVPPRGDGWVDFEATDPALVSVKLIDSEVIREITSQLELRNLRQVQDGAVAASDYAFDLTDNRGQSIAQFAWTPKRPGSEIVYSVVPFILIALGGFAILAAVVFRQMRRTAATIAAGETRLRHLALHDPLCGLPNRVFFSERLEATIERVQRGGSPAAVLYIDLDHFKDVNDTLGHPIGDELIRNVTQRLTQTVREGDLVARIGGDEFAVITAASEDHAALMAIANRVIAMLCAPYIIAGQTIVIGSSIGIALIDKGVHDAADVLRYADMALYRAKNEGRNRACIYDTAMDADLVKRKLLEADLRAAIENDQLRVAYQPIVNSSGDTIIGVEALCRWTHPVRGEIPPVEFIPIAEDSGLIIELGEWVLRRACLDGKAWPDIFISVNVSPLQFRRTEFVDTVERILAETEFDATRLELEVTESTLIGNVETAELAMFRLKAFGVRLALDDFGTGYSSLLYLRRFPFDKLKVDRSFVHSIEKAADAAAIVHAVVSLGRGLGMKVTAEGVESAEQQLFLRAAGVHSMQGYRFGRPGPAEAISGRLAAPDSFRIGDEDTAAGLAMAG
jgi:diguanylate cyclase (GGDEF)-like protein